MGVELSDTDFAHSNAQAWWTTNCGPDASPTNVS